MRTYHGLSLKSVTEGSQSHKMAPQPDLAPQNKVSHLKYHYYVLTLCFTLTLKWYSCCTCWKHPNLLCFLTLSLISFLYLGKSKKVCKKYFYCFLLLTHMWLLFPKLEDKCNVQLFSCFLSSILNLILVQLSQFWLYFFPLFPFPLLSWIYTYVLYILKSPIQ